MKTFADRYSFPPVWNFVSTDDEKCKKAEAERQRRGNKRKGSTGRVLQPLSTSFPADIPDLEE